MQNNKTDGLAIIETEEEFRCKLVSSILNDEILTSFDDEKRELLLSRLSCAYTISEPTHDQARFRTLEKVSANASRLKTAINQLTLKDGEILDARLKDLTTLSEIEIFLELLNKDASKLAEIVNGEYNKIKSLQEKLNAGSLINTLRLFEIPCSIRNDYADQEKQKNTSQTIKENQNKTSKYPNLDDRTSLAMRCVLLAMIDGKQKKLSWSKTISIIKKGIDYHANKSQKIDALLGITTLEDTESFRLYTLKTPIWTAIKL